VTKPLLPNDPNTEMPVSPADRSTAAGLASVVIAAHNAEDTLGRQLQALANQTDAGEFEVVVALNRCTDRSRKVAEGFTDRLTMTIVDAPDEASAGYARNVGVAHTHGDTLLFCDADDVVDHRWVAELTDAMTAQNLDVVGGTIMVDRSRVPTWIYRSAYRYMDGRCLLEFGQVPYAITATMGCRRAAFDAVGGFEPNLPGTAGGEDTELGIRLWQAGCSIGEAPKALLTYTPRVTTAAFIRRQRAHIDTTTALQIREQGLERPSRWRMCSRPIIVGGYVVLIRHEWRPRVVAVAMAESFYSHRARRRMIPPIAQDRSAAVG
jgi:GT2 family glycosyltransferase